MVESKTKWHSGLKNRSQRSSKTNTRQGGFQDEGRSTAAAHDIMAMIAAAGFVIVPKEPTPEMIAAGTAADWVGEVEGRAGLSIMPVESDYVSSPGIWPAMIAKAQQP